MGNNICCQDSHQRQGEIEKLEGELQVKKVALHKEVEEERQEESNIKVENSLDQLVHSHHQHNQHVQVVEEKEEVIQIPPLWPRAKETIQKKKFFQIEFSAIPHSYSRRYGQDIYVGELDQQKIRPNGLGKMYKQDGNIYIGSFQNGRAHGQGAFIFSNGSYYHGQFNNNKAETLQGLGEYESQHLKYIGEFKNNTFHGKGKQTGNQHQFQGHYENGRRTKGTLKWKAKDGDYLYTGDFNDKNKFHGNGTLIEPNGTYKGQFSEGEKHGHGQYNQKNGAKYNGQYKNNGRTGFGTIYNDDGSVAYKGHLLDGLPHGKGTVIQEGKQVQVTWVQGIDSSILEP